MTEISLMVLVGAAIAFLVGRYALPIGEFLGLMDYPDPEGGRKLHAKATPLVGGFAIACVTIVSTLLMFIFGAEDLSRSALTWFIVTVTGLFVVGAMDDRIGLTAPTRLAAASIFLLGAIAQVPDFAINFLLFSGQSTLLLMQGVLGIIFTLICFVGLLNAVNMADGKNGLVIGQSLVWCAVLMVRLPASMVPLMAAITGALAVLFVYNMRGKLFLGDGGSYCLSAMFGLLAIYAWNHGFADMNADDVALIFAIPVFDTLRLIVLRLSKGRSPFTPGRDHLHHYLYARWGWPRPLPWLLALAAIPNLMAILFPGTGFIWLGVTLVGYLLLLFVANRGSETSSA